MESTKSESVLLRKNLQNIKTRLTREQEQTILIYGVLILYTEWKRFVTPTKFIIDIELRYKFVNAMKNFVTTTNILIDSTKM